MQVPLGISYISSSLKEAGHTTEMLLYTKHNTNTVLETIKKRPSVFAISIASPDDFVTAQTSILFENIKKRYQDAKIILGGTGITLLSDNLWGARDRLQDIDALCIGEGEKALVEYVAEVAANRFYKTDNLIIKDNDHHWIKYEKAFFIKNLEDLPYPDMDGWDDFVKTGEKVQIQLSISRGCCNQCIYCSNQLFAHKAVGNFYRVREVESVVKEVDYLYKKYKNLEYILFQAESGIVNLNYFVNLCKALIKYNENKQDKLQFAIALNFMPSFLNNNVKLADLIRDANITMLRFSVESGSLEIREKIKRPYYTNEQIITFCERLRANHIKYKLSAMYCFPFETKQTYAMTIELLRKCKPDSVDISFLKSFTGTPLYILLKEIGDPKVKFADFYRWITCKLRVYMGYKSLYAICFKELPHNVKNISLIFRIRSTYKVYKDRTKIQNIQTAKEEFDKGNFGRAVKYFNKVHITENESWIYGDRAIAEMNTGRYKAALKDFDKALQFCPDEVYRQKKEECLSKIKEAD
ncbi:MAG: radical SAM protein [Endomicrobiaceae bacterium]|nr:radical SAM protein [Endomicrobiaceae bacterium]